MSKKHKSKPVKEVQNNFKKNIAILVALSIITKIAISFLTTSVFHSFIDTFDLSYYLQHGVYVFVNHQLPYVNFNFDYPPLLYIPISIAMIIATIFQSGDIFFFTFMALMALCDIGIVVCIYFIGLKIWDNERAALAAGVLYASAFSVAYFVITKYDAFPTFLLMLAITLTLYKQELKGYTAGILGFFTKIFPVVALPFLILYNAKTTSIKQEIISAAKIGIPVAAVLVLPFFVLNSTNTIRTYLYATGSSLGIFANTATYTIYSLLFQLVPLDSISILMTGGMVLSICALVYIAYKQPAQEPVTLLKLILCALFALIFFTKFHSPQYIVWLTPFFALLAIGDTMNMLYFYVIQGLAYIEFPLIFGSVYTNPAYTSTVVGSPGWVVAVLFFTIEYVALIWYTYNLVNPRELI